MKALAAFVFAIVAAVVVGVLLSREPGYVLVAYGTTRVEFTLFIFLLIYFAALILGGLGWNLIRRLRGVPAGMRRRREMRAYRRAERMFTSGIEALAEGRLAAAERALEYAAYGALTLPALLAAARAADNAGAAERRDRYLQRAWEEYPKAAPAVLLTQAQLDFDKGDYERALAALQRLRSGRGAHPQAVRNLARVYAALNEHGKLIDLLPELLREEVLPEAELEQLAAEAARGELSTGKVDAATLWRRLPSHIRDLTPVRRALASGYAAAGDERRAGELLTRNLTSSYDAESVTQYAALGSIEASVRMHSLETWLDRYGDRAALLREAGRVALELQLWGQARSYLEQARQTSADTQAALLAGQIAERENRQKDALAIYREGLAAAARREPGGGTG